MLVVRPRAMCGPFILGGGIDYFLLTVDGIAGWIDQDQEVLWAGLGEILASRVKYLLSTGGLVF